MTMYLKDESKYAPEQAIIIYRQRNHSNHYYLESHDILESGNALLLGEGKPLKKESIKEMAKALADDINEALSSKYLLPENLIYINQKPGFNILAWILPESKKSLFFIRELNIPSGLASCPALLFIVKNKQLFVYALESSKRSLTVKVFKAPFHNIYENGSVCLGNAETDNNIQSFEEAIIYWQKMFFQSEFSSELSQKQVKGNINLLWKELIETKKAFPKQMLIPHPHYKNIKQLLDSLGADD